MFISDIDIDPISIKREKRELKCESTSETKIDLEQSANRVAYKDIIEHHTLWNMKNTQNALEFAFNSTSKRVILRLYKNFPRKFNCVLCNSYLFLKFK